MANVRHEPGHRLSTIEILPEMPSEVYILADTGQQGPNSRKGHHNPDSNKGHSISTVEIFRGLSPAPSEAIFESVDSQDTSDLRLSKHRFFVVFATLNLVLAINGLDANILGDAAPVIAGKLHTVHISWLASVTFITGTGLILPCSVLYQRHEPKYILLASLVLFGVAEAVAGSARSFNVLLVGRLLVGVAECSTAIAAFLITSLICQNSRERAMYLSLVTALYGLMIKVGPLVAGAFLKSSDNNWRWCFFVNIPIIGVTTTLLLIGSPKFNTAKGHSNKLHTKDDLRLLLSTIVQGLFVTATLVPCLLGGASLAWTSGILVACYILAPIFLAVFLVLELRAPDACRLLPLERLRSSRQLGAISVITFSAILSTFASTFFVPIYFQVVYGSSPIHAAVQLLPLALPGTIACIVVGKVVEQTGTYVPCCIILSATQILGSGLFYSINVETHLAVLYVYEVILGIGCGGLVAIGTTVALHEAKRFEYARLVAWINWILLLAASIGIGVQGAILASQLKSALAEIAKILGTSVVRQSSIIDLLAYLKLAGSNIEVVEIVRGHAVKAQSDASLMYLAAGAISLAASLSLRRQKL